ncbi:hypothetical protein R1flu_013311 [Riccia fluitans]|uniref:NB-ARC domain-containing protein n=1 Tax=Riccia fluitans TaxID=41844 RepID=A0ABD1YD71_9MARC
MNPAVAPSEFPLETELQEHDLTAQVVMSDAATTLDDYQSFSDGLISQALGVLMWCELTEGSGGGAETVIVSLSNAASVIRAVMGLVEKCKSVRSRLKRIYNGWRPASPPPAEGPSAGSAQTGSKISYNEELIRIHDGVYELGSLQPQPGISSNNTITAVQCSDEGPSAGSAQAEGSPGSKISYREELIRIHDGVYELGSLQPQPGISSNNTITAAQCSGEGPSAGSAQAEGSSGSKISYREELIRIHDGVYELGSLPSGTLPSVEFVFFHGLQLASPQDNDIHLRTWTSENDAQLWPKWLKDEENFPNARILFTSYDAWAQENSTEGRFDSFTSAENVLTWLTDKNNGVGQRGCPVILIGHGTGCLLIKEVCQQAHNRLHGLDSGSATQELDFFLRFIRGMFFFSPPSLGMEFASELIPRIDSPAPWLKISERYSVDATRLGDFFMKVRRNRYNWKICAVGETQPLDLASKPLKFLQASKPLNFPYNDVMVPEGSSRYDVDFYHSINANYISISRPSDKKSMSFGFLTKFVADLCAEPEIVGQDLKSIIEDVPKTFGLDHTLDELDKWLPQGNGRREMPQVGYIGLAGMGGIGKTTLAKSFLANKCFGRPGRCTSEGFEYCCILKMDAAIDDLKSLKSSLLSKMHRWGRKMPSTLELNWRALEKKKVLILLDDVQDKSQILDARIDHGFGPGSLVMATSRVRSFLQEAGYRIHDVKKLEDRFSREFLDHAFDKCESRSIYHERVSELLRICGGLPLALEETSKYLRSRKNEKIWESALHRIKRAGAFTGSKNKNGNKLWDSLTQSYDELEDLEKYMFVDISTCFYGEEAEEVMAAWKALDSDSAVYLGCWNLLNRSLVKCSGDFAPISVTGEHSWFVKGTRLKTKHKLLKYLAEKKKRKESTYKQQRVHVFDESTRKNLLNLKLHNEQEVIRNVLIMKIDCWLSGSIDVEFISSFYNLKVLWLTKVSLSSESVAPSSLPLDRDDGATLSSLGSLLWKQSKGSGISRLVDGSLLQHLHSSPDPSGTAKFPLIHSRPLSTYKNLEHLVLNSFELEELPDCFNSLLKLDHLEISNCSKLKSLPSRFTDLVKIRRLFLIGLESLIALPTSFGSFKCLEQFELRKCSKLENFEFLLTLQSVKQLALEELQLETLHDDPPFQNLQCFELRGCRYLTTLPSWLEAPKVQHLKLIDLRSLCQDTIMLLDRIAKRLQTNLTIIDCSVPGPLI